MELVYLWVEEYKNIKQQGFNFSPRFDCKYDLEKKELTINENKNYLENFFGGNINITAIVGENGSGKSSILELLKSDYDFFEIGQFFFLYYDVKNNKFQSPGLETFDYKKTPMKVSFLKEISLIPKTKTIFYTHLFHNDYNIKLHSVNLHHTEVLNISSLYELANDETLATNPTNMEVMSKTDFFKIMRTYHTRQIQKAILALKDERFILPFEAPRFCKIKHMRTETLLEQIISNSQNNKVKDICEKILKLYEANLVSWEKTGKLQEIDDLGIKILLAFIVENTTNVSDDEYIEPFLEEIATLTTEENIHEYADRIYKKLTEQKFTYFSEKDNRNVHFPNIKQYFENMKAFLEEYKKLNIYPNGKSPISHSLDEIVIDIQNNDFTFLDLYLKLTRNAVSFFEFSWLNLSSGEETFLYQFARFFYLKNYPHEPSDNLNNTDNLIILFDEGETTLHPQWQKKYINYCVDFFKQNFSDYTCHLIFTSHSPFLLSDLPKENVIFLKDGASDNPDIQQTFGANIHTLLAHGFFMKDGLMGEFAKGKINEVIALLTKEQLSKEEIKVCKQIISIIGEPILQKTLKHQLNEKINPKENALQKLEREQKEIQEKIDKLKRKNNETN